MKIRLMAFALIARGLFAQSFEVATVKPSTPQDRFIEMFTYPGGRVTVQNYTLQMLMEDAFRVQPFQISGGPNWVREDKFSIDARPPANSKSSQSNPGNPKLPPNDEQRQMLRALLIERFGLKFHVEKKEGSVYLLTKGKGELKLEPAKDKNAFPWTGSIGGGGFGGDGVRGTNITMPLLAERLAPYFGRPVIDQTGIEGAFDFRFEYHAGEPKPDLISSIITSLQGLGLKLESSKGPVEYLVIDHADKLSAN